MVYSKNRNNKKKAIKKRTTNYKKRKAPFKKKAKAKFALKRAPFVEVKAQSHTDLWNHMDDAGAGAVRDTIVDPKHPVQMCTVNADPTLNNVPFISKSFPIWSYLNPIQGVGEKEMLGRSLTAKYLQARVHFEFPIRPVVQNPRYYMIHGWVTVAPNLTEFTSPIRANLTRAELINHIDTQIVNDFNNDANDEFLDFKQKQNKNYKIIGYRRIKPKMNDQQVNPQMLINQDGTTINPDVYGHPSPQNHTFNWPLNNREVRYSTGNTSAHNTPFLYPNDKGTWLPFLIYYCPDTHLIPLSTVNVGNPPVPTAIYNDNQSPTISYDNKFHFSDS